MTDGMTSLYKFVHPDSWVKPCSFIFFSSLEETLTQIAESGAKGATHICYALPNHIQAVVYIDIMTEKKPQVLMGQ